MVLGLFLGVPVFMVLTNYSVEFVVFMGLQTFFKNDLTFWVFRVIDKQTYKNKQKRKATEIQ